MSNDRQAHGDQLLRQVLQDEARSAHPSPDWDDVRERAGRRRRWAVRAAAAATVLVVVGVAAMAASGDDGDTNVAADDPDRTLPAGATSTTHTPTTVTTTTTPAQMRAGPEVDALELPAGDPLGDDELVASIQVPGNEFPGVEIVVLSKETGEVVRRLAAGYDTVEGGVTELTLTPDRRTVLYSVSTAACAARIEAVAVDGSGAAVPVADSGNQVAVSPDGAHLAIDTGDICYGPAQIDLVPLAGGSVTRYTSLAPEGRAVQSMAFEADDTLLLVTSNTQQRDARTHLYSLHLESGIGGPLQPAGDLPMYTSLERWQGVVTALETAERSHHLVTLEDGQVASREPVEVEVEDAAAIQTIGFDSSGRLVMAEGFGTLHVDGRILREDVLDVTF